MLFPLDSDDTARPAFRVGDINPTLTAAHARGEKIAEAFRVATTGWADHETYGAAVEALTAAGLHLCLVYPPDTLPGNEKTPVSRRHCLTTEQQTSSDYTAHGRNLDAVHLATNDPQRIAEMTAEFLRHYPGKLPNLGVHLHPSRLIVADYDTPTQTAAFDNARRSGDRDAHTDHPGPTVTTPGKRNDSGAWTHSDGGHSYYVLPHGIDGDNADVPINGSTEKWSILGGPGKYVMLPGSRRTEGPYEYTGHPIDVAGPWLTRKLARPTRSTGARGVRTASPTMSGSGGDTPLDHWSRAHPWHELLTADGWTGTGPSGCGSHCTQWQHPDASSPRSAITHGDGCTEGYTPGDDGAYPLYMFSGSHPTLEAGRAYTRAQYALTARYGGDWATFHREEDTASYENTGLAELTDFSLEDFMAHLSDPADTEPQETPAAEPVTASTVSTPATTTPTTTASVGLLAGMTEDDFWASRDVLTHIYRFALARYASPWAVLGVVLVRTLSRVAYNVQIPPIVGGRASLNLFVALVGDSGTGKGAATATARDAVTLPGAEIEPHTPGSGEGFARLLGHWTKGTKSTPAELIREYSAIIDLPEIDTLAAISARGGSTYLSEFRKAYSGEALGRRNNSDDRSVIIPSHTYRLGAIVGVQPNRSAVLLDDADGGTPQRFLWLPAQYAVPRHPDPAPPAWPDPITPVLTAYLDPVKLHTGNPVHELVLPAVAIEHTRDIRWRRMNRETGKDLDAHANLTRLKVTAALAILDGRINPTDDDWNLAAAVLAKSDATREECTKAMQQVAHEANINRGKAAGIHAVAQNAIIEKAATARVSTNLTRHLDDGEWHSASELRRRIKHSDRSYVGDVLEQLRVLGQIEVRDHPTRPGEQVRRTPPK